MPKRRPPASVWRQLRIIVYKRDKGRCQHCGRFVSLVDSDTDHIISGKRGNNRLVNLRTLCEVCHALRRDNRHGYLHWRLAKEGRLPSDWEDMLWDDN